MAEGAVHVAVEGPVAIITLDRPEKLNALTAPMLRALQDVAERIDGDNSLRVAVITGEGPRAFCAGADIEAWSGLTPLDMWRRWVREGHRVFDALARMRQPLVAAINGHALGGGLELAAVADLRIADAAARFGLPEVSIGMVPGWSGTQRLLQRAGAQSVRRLALTGELVSAEVAHRLGVVDEVTEAGQVMLRARELAEMIASRAPTAVQIAKTLINAAEGEESAAGMEGLAGALVSYTDDAREGVASFRQKRAPAFTGR